MLRKRLVGELDEIFDHDAGLFGVDFIVSVHRKNLY
jgi:hypothetical protein